MTALITVLTAVSSITASIAAIYAALNHGKVKDVQQRIKNGAGNNGNSLLP